MPLNEYKRGSRSGVANKTGDYPGLSLSKTVNDSQPAANSYHPNRYHGQSAFPGIVGQSFKIHELTGS